MPLCLVVHSMYLQAQVSLPTFYSVYFGRSIKLRQIRSAQYGHLVNTGTFSRC